MEKGWSHRSVGATLMNADSSRSHSIFTIHLERCDNDDKGEGHIRAAKLNLVDLAGSERQSKTGHWVIDYMDFEVRFNWTSLVTSITKVIVQIICFKAFNKLI